MSEPTKDNENDVEFVDLPDETVDNDLLEEGRQLASERDDLIADGVDPAELKVPLAPTVSEKEVSSEETSKSPSWLHRTLRSPQRSEPQPGADEDGFGGDAPEPEQTEEEEIDPTEVSTDVNAEEPSSSADVEAEDDLAGDEGDEAHEPARSRRLNKKLRQLKKYRDIEDDVSAE